MDKGNKVLNKYFSPMEPWITKKQNLKSKRKHTMKKEKAEGPLLEPPF